MDDIREERMALKFRVHGNRLPKVVVVHGGPGGAGEVEPLALALAERSHGVLEPFQTGRSIASQTAELADAIEQIASPPVVLVGWSWGAWLSLILTTEAPSRVARLVLVGCPPFEASAATTIAPTRRSRLSPQECEQVARLESDLSDPASLRRFMALIDKADAFAPVAAPPPRIEYDADIHRAVWTEAAGERSSGRLLERLSNIQRPVTAIHGDRDPHPADGVERPLRRVLPEAEFILLSRCGHKPWQERFARAAFLDTLDRVIDAQERSEFNSSSADKETPDAD